jgi:integrase
MLTDLALRTAKLAAKPYKLSDSGGLYLLVTTKGQRYWRFDYRFMGKRKTLALGVYPSTSLAEARLKRDDARKSLADNKDPSEKRRIDKLTAHISAENTFQAIAEEYIGKLEREGRAEATLDKIKWLLSFAYPLIGRRPITEITAPELLAVLRKLETRGRYESARRLRGTCGQVFRYAIATGRAERDISADLHGALTTPKVTHRAAITEPKLVGQLLRAIEAFEGQPTTHAALRLAPHVFVRPGELRQAEWEEFDFQKAIWTIPAHKAKMRRSHKVPLSRQALAILEALAPITGQGRYLFPSLRTASRALSENSINAALRRLGFGKEEMTGHGFRAMASTSSTKWANGMPTPLNGNWAMWRATTFAAPTRVGSIGMNG